MANDNDILKELNEALDSGETPKWARPLIRCIRDDHRDMRAHLSWHERLAKAATQIALAIVSVVAVALVVWILAGRFPGVFK